MKNIKSIILLVVLFGIINPLRAQDEDFFEQFGEQKSIYDMSLEELFNTNVSSVSKKSESLFEAPLSASVVTYEEFERAGCTSIMEALRLIPGVVVREQTNGMYEVFIRGGENSVKGSFMPYFANSVSLVMIDGRPVYNYLQGGTFWETLPVGLHDIERIEVVRGAMAALYGPNALSGVINIITRRPKNYTMYSNANVQAGNNGTLTGGASLGYKWNKKLDLVVSGNYQRRDRYQDSYYVYSKNEYVNDINEIEAVFGAPIEGLAQKFPDPGLALDQYGLNGYLNYNPVDRVKFSLAAGSQNSWAQRAYSENTATPFSTSESNTRYFDLRTNIHNLSGQVSWMGGKQSPALDFFGLTYDLNTIEAFFEYDFIFGSNDGGSAAFGQSNFGEFKVGFLPAGHSISLRPGLNYRKAVYDDRKYWEAGAGFINAKGELTTQALSLKADYDINKKFRFTTAIRNDRHNYPEGKNHVSIQSSIKYHITPKHIVRGTYSRAYRGVYILDTYSNFTLNADFPREHFFFTEMLIKGSIQELTSMGLDQQTAAFLAPQMWNSAAYNFQFRGNRDLDLLKTDMIEIGYRGRLSKHVSIDLEAFMTKYSNFVYPIISGDETLQTQVVGSIPVAPGLNLPVMDAELLVDNVNTNFPQEFEQRGVTLSLNYLNQNFQVKPFVNVQESKINNYTAYPEDSASYNELINIYHKGTPMVYGGAYINYQLKKLNFNISPYFMTSSEMLHDFGALRPPLSDGNLPEGTADMKLNGKLIMNANISYQLLEILRLNINLRNISTNDSQEYFFTDRIKPNFLIGLNFSY